MKYFLPLTFLSISLTMLNAKNVYAFNLGYKYPANSMNYNPSSANYRTYGKNSGSVWINPIEKISPPSDKFLRRFTVQFPNWTFRSSDTPIYGDLIVNAYRPCYPGKQNPCLDSGSTWNVGATLDLDYIPNGFPDPNTGSVHWLQWIRDNHSIKGSHDDLEETLDTKSDTPFYYGDRSNLSNQKNPYYFYDQSSRTDSGQDHFWQARLFLANQKEGQTVDVFGGVFWEWENQVKRKKDEPDPPLVCPVNATPSNCQPGPPDLPQQRPLEPCPPWLSIGSCISYGYNVNATNPLLNESNLTFDEAISQSSTPPEQVPTPALLPTLVATGIYHGRKWRKRKNQNPDNATA